MKRHHQRPTETTPAKEGATLQSALVGLELHHPNGLRTRVTFPENWKSFDLSTLRRGWYPFRICVRPNAVNVDVDGSFYQTVSDVVEIEKVFEVDRLLDGNLETVTESETIWER